MIVNHYAIYDSKAQHYGQLFPSQTHGAAERLFSDSVNKPDSPHNAHPDDYSLYYIGEYDDDSGRFLTQDMPLKLVHGKQLLRD